MPIRQGGSYLKSKTGSEAQLVARTDAPRDLKENPEKKSAVADIAAPDDKASPKTASTGTTSPSKKSKETS